ncbi:MAG TPA: Ig-like domain-containing protein, partial [Mycobacteriales bacterium]|nr:Ig-like domain-containing protein [Mycobacteriales bacterium]
MGPRRARSAALVAVAAAAALVGCNSAGSPAQGTTQVGFVSITPAAQSTGIRPDARVRVHVTQGKVRSVTVSDGSGGTLSGVLSADHRTWQSRTPLQTDTVYDVTAAAADAKGHAITVTTVFWTLKSSQHLAARIAPLTGETVGVGMPIAVYFTAPVKNRAAVEARFHVTSAKHVVGAWHWYSDREMHYRPPQFWPADDHVSLRYDLRGIDAGGGVWGDQHRTIAFSIGASHVSKVYARTHTMNVYDDGHLVQTYPVSTGRDKYPTTSGIHVVLNKNPDQLM